MDEGNGREGSNVKEEGGKRALKEGACKRTSGPRAHTLDGKLGLGSGLGVWALWWLAWHQSLASSLGRHCSQLGFMVFMGDD